jgi:hypothetical protein
MKTTLKKIKILLTYFNEFYFCPFFTGIEISDLGLLIIQAVNFFHCLRIYNEFLFYFFLYSIFLCQFETACVVINLNYYLKVRLP